MIALSPKIKILFYIFLAIAVFLSDSFRISLFLFCIVVVFSIKVPLSTLKRGLIPIVIFLTFTFLSNLFFQTGKTIYEFFGLSVTDEGLRRGGQLTLRLLILILGAKALTATTKPEDLVNGIKGLLGPVGRLGPVKEFIFTLSLTMRLLPIIYNEAIELYRSRVKNSPKTGLAGKIKLSVTLLTPLFERSLKKAKELSEMEEKFEH